MALTETEAEAASKTGGILPGVEVAGGVTTPILGAVLKMLGGVPTNLKNKDAVPVPMSERNIETGTGTNKLMPEVSYEQRQQNLAPKILSEEGQKRFNEAGGSGVDAVFPPKPDAVVDAAREAMDGAPPPVAPVAPVINDGAASRTIDGVPPGAAAQPLDISEIVTVRGGDIEGADFNFERLKTGDDVKALFNHFSDVNAAKIDDAKRGVVSNKQTEEEAAGLLADELGFTTSLLKRQTGEMLNAAQMTAARILLVKSGERLVTMATKIKDGQATAVEMVEFRRQMAIHAGIQQQAKAAQTEIARALQAFNIPASANTVELRGDFAATLLNETGGAGSTEKLAKSLLDNRATAIKNGQNPNAASNKFVEKGAFALTEKAVLEVVVNGMLSMFPTHLKNFFATPLFMAYRNVEELGAGLIGTGDRAVRKALGKPLSDDEVYIGQFVARMYGQVKSVREAFMVAADTWKLEAAADPMSKLQQTGTFKAIDSDEFSQSRSALLRQAMQNDSIARGVDIIGQLIRIPGRGLQAGDDFWKLISSRGELFSQAYHAAARAKALGKTDADALDDAALIMLDPRSSAKSSSDSARLDTMTSETGFLGDIANFIHKMPLVGRLYLPFTTAPTNSILRFAERTPLGLAAGFTKGADGTYKFKNPAARQRIMSRVALGTTTMYMLHGYAVEGRFTGAMPSDARQREMLPPNWKPYSFVERGAGWPLDKDGDPLPLFDSRFRPNGKLIYTSYAGLEPLSMLLGVAAETAERMRRSNKVTDLPSAAIGATLQYVGDMPMLKSIGDLVKAFEYGNLARVLGSPLRALVPYSAVVGAVEKQTSPEKRRPSKDFKYYTMDDVRKMPLNAQGEMQIELVGTIKNGNFGATMSEYRSMLTDRGLYGGASDDTSAVQYDVLGKAKEHGVRFDVNPGLAIYNFISPFKRTVGKELTYVEGEIMRLQGPLRESKNKQGGMTFDDAFAAQWTNAAKNIVEIVIYSQKDGGDMAMKFRPALEALMDSNRYQDRIGDPKAQISMIKQLENKFFDAGFQMVIDLDKHDDEREAYEDMQDANKELDRQGRLR